MNNIIKKGMAIGIICLLMLVSVPTVVSENGKPDFKIVDVKLGYDRGWPHALIYIENCGSGVSWNGECRLTFKKLFENTTMYSRASNWGYNKYHSNGGIKVLKTWTFIEEYERELPHLFFGRIFFEVDPNDKINESDEENNVVWTFIFLWWHKFLQGMMGTRIIMGRLRQQ